MHVLILGGTAEARELAAVLVDVPDVEVTSSLAGATSNPRLPPGRLVTGGFGGPGGLADFLQHERVDAVVDATHPYAATISANAVAASARAKVPLVVLRRPGWTAQDGDIWNKVPDIAAAAAQVRTICPLGSRVLVTTGRHGLAPFADDTERQYIIRVVDPPRCRLPVNHHVLVDRGPYTRDGELAMMRQFDVDVLVTKNSGGELTRAKIDAARDLHVPVIIIDRPATPDGCVTRIEEVISRLRVAGASTCANPEGLPGTSWRSGRALRGIGTHT